MRTAWIFNRQRRAITARDVEIAELREENARLREQLKLAQQIPSHAELDRWEREWFQWVLDEGGFGGA